MKMNFKTSKLGSLTMLALLATSIMACSKKSFDTAPAQTQFIQGDVTNSKVDIIMMVDNSTSMSQHQKKLSSQISSMISQLNSMGLDWHIGVTTSDMSTSGTGGYLNGAGTAIDPTYITPTTANGMQILTNRVMAGENGSDYEKGIESVKSSIGNILDPAANNPDKGFWRDDAVLALIFLSDEDDIGATTVADFEKYMDQVKKPFPSGQKGWVANFLGLLDINPTCTSGPFAYPAPGFKYMQLVDYTAGVKESICTSSLDVAVQNVKVRILEFLKDFYIPRIPIVSTIKVYKNGVLVPASTTDGWEYLPANHTIRFHGTAVPNSSDKIKVDFQPLEAT